MVGGGGTALGRPDLVHLDAVLARALAKDANARYRIASTLPRPSRSRVHAAMSLRRIPQADSQTKQSGHTTQFVRKAVHPAAASSSVWSFMGQHAASSKARSAPLGQLGTLWFPISVPYDPIKQPACSHSDVNPSTTGKNLQTATRSRSLGVWDGDTLDADTIVSFSADTNRNDDCPPAARKSPRDKAQGNSRRGRTAALVALVGVIVLTGAAVAWFTDGFGAWTRPGPIIKPVSATVFHPGGAPDNPQQAGSAIDGNPDTSWSTAWPARIQSHSQFNRGRGTAVASVRSDRAECRHYRLVRNGRPRCRSAHRPPKPQEPVGRHDGASPTTPLQPGHNRIAVRDRTKTSNVLVWITNWARPMARVGRRRSSEITLQAAASRRGRGPSRRPRPTFPLSSCDLRSVSPCGRATRASTVSWRETKRARAIHGEGPHLCGPSSGAAGNRTRFGVLVSEPDGYRGGE